MLEARLCGVAGDWPQLLEVSLIASRLNVCSLAQSNPERRSINTRSGMTCLTNTQGGNTLPKRPRRIHLEHKRCQPGLQTLTYSPRCAFHRGLGTAAKG